MRLLRYFYYGFSIVILSIAALSCQSIESVSPPQTLIPEDQMVEILTDIAFVRAAKISQKKVLEDQNFNPERYVLSLHRIDSVTFAENNTWYARNIAQYEAIFIRVKEQLEYCKLEYEALDKEEKALERKKKDSLQKLKQDSKNT